MGLFDKKTCDICGGKIGLLGNRKLEDGNMCADCAKKLSPFTTDRRRSTLATIREHLAYREANKAAVAAFNITRATSGKTKVLIDDGAGTFIVTSSNNWKNDNPDVIQLSQIVSCSAFTNETKTEIMTTDKNNKKVSYFPRRYKIEYDYNVEITVNAPFFDEISFQLASGIDSESRDGDRYYRQLMEIKEALSANAPGAQAARAQAATVQAAAAPAPVAAEGQGAAPSGPRTCSHCGAEAGSGKFCEFCGSPLNG